MHFDFDGRYQDHQSVGGGLRRWDGVLISVVSHAAFVLAVMFVPLPTLLQREADTEVPAPAPARERTEFVFVQPRVDRPAPQAPERAEASDQNRIASAERASAPPTNALPFARGNSAERVEASPDERARGEGPGPTPSPEPSAPEPDERVPPPESQRTAMTVPQSPPRPPQGGSLGDALRNLQKYVDRESFQNDRGQAQNLGPLQFDTKGVEFGPWIRRFVAQVRRNWFVPMAAMSLRGQVVLTFFVHRNGALTDVQVIRPSAVESFNVAARNALLASNPTQPLPPEYPDDKALFTVTFFYNETP